MPALQRPLLAAAVAACCVFPAAGSEEEAESPEIDVLRKHIDSNGGVVSKNVRVVEDSTGNRGLRAVGPGLEAGELILSIPWELTMVGSGEKQSEDVSMGELHLYLELLKELHDPSSKHRAYLRTLPGTFTNAAFWNEKDLECLSPNSKVHNNHFVKQLERFGSIALEVQKTQPESFFGAQKFSKAELYATYSVIFTRALRSGKDALLIPFFDLLNHDSDPTVAVTFTEVGVTVAALQDIPPEEELKITYGNHLTPAMLLVYYGFVDNSFTNVSSHFNFEVNDRTQPLVEAGCQNLLDLVIFRDGTLSEKLVECLVLTVLPVENRTAYNEMSAEEKAATVAAQRLTALQVYAPHLVKITSQYPSSYDAPCDSQEGNIPLIQASNELIREVYLNAKQKIDDEVKESGASRVEVQNGEERKKRKKRRREEDSEEL